MGTCLETRFQIWREL